MSAYDETSESGLVRSGRARSGQVGQVGSGRDRSGQVSSGQVSSSIVNGQQDIKPLAQTYGICLLNLQSNLFLKITIRDSVERIFAILRAALTRHLRVRAPSEPPELLSSLDSVIKKGGRSSAAYGSLALIFRQQWHTCSAVENNSRTCSGPRCFAQVTQLQPGMGHGWSCISHPVSSLLHLHPQQSRPGTHVVDIT